MSTQEEMADYSVNGLIMSDRQKEIAAANGIDLDNSEVVKEETTVDAPVGENVEEAEQQTLEVNEQAVDSLDPFAETYDEDHNEESSEEQVDSFEGYPKGFKKQLKRKERQIGRLERELGEIKSQLSQPREQTSTQTQPTTLSPENFKNQQEYIDYLVDQKLQTTLQKQAELQSEQVQQQEQFNEMKTVWDSKVSEQIPESELGEYTEAITSMGNPETALGTELATYVFNNPQGPQLLKYFADHPGLTQRLGSMDAYTKLDAVKRVEQYVANKATKPIVKQVSKATPVGGLSQNSAGTSVQSIDKMTDAERINAYRKGKWNPFK